MKWAHRKFENERGREIRVEVAVGGAGPGDIRVTVTSPATCDEGFYTLREAEHLRDALNEALS